jgi:methylphosphotriester-DNA--protein-cysteine methyltransferase
MYAETELRKTASETASETHRMPQVGAACNALEEAVATGEKLLQELEARFATVLRSEPTAAGLMPKDAETAVGLAQRLNEIAHRARLVNDHIVSITRRAEL